MNIYSEVGLITLVGLISKNGILIVEFANQLQRQGRTKMQAIRESAMLRLRPVLMTTVATIAGNFPLTLVTGAGAAARNSIGIVLVSGMTIGTLFTLLVVPSIYILIAKDHGGGNARRNGGNLIQPMNETPASPPPPVKNGNGRPIQSAKIVWPAAVALAVLLYFGIALLVEVFTHESTDDAFIAGHVVSIAPRIAGQVAAVHVLDNQLVRSNDLLVEIDPADYAMIVAQKTSAADAQQASYQTMLAGWQLMQAKVTTAEADVRKAQADADAAESTAKKTQADFERAQDLLKQKTVSQQEFDATQAANTKAQADLKSAQENVIEAGSARRGSQSHARRRVGAGRRHRGRNGRRRRPTSPPPKSIWPTRKFLRPPTAASRARPWSPAIISRPASRSCPSCRRKSGWWRTSRNRS